MDNIYSMRCEDIEIYLEDYYQGLLDPALNQQVRAHLKQCPDCMKLYQETKEILDSLSSIKAPKVSDDFINSTLSKMKSAFTPAPIIAPQPSYYYTPARSSFGISTILVIALPVLFCMGILSVFVAAGSGAKPMIENAKHGKITYDPSFMNYDALNALEKVEKAEISSRLTELSFIDKIIDYAKGIPFWIPVFLAFVIATFFVLFGDEKFALF